METSWTIFEMYIAIFGLITAYGLWADKKGKGGTLELLETTKKRIAANASLFNRNIKALEREFRKQGKGSVHNRKMYEYKYNVVKIDYDRQTAELIRAWKASPRTDRHWVWFWRIFIVIGVITLFWACSNTIIEEAARQQPVNENLLKSFTEQREWNARDIPMPHMTDGRRYVSNPDSLVSEQTVSLLDAQLKKLDDSLGIESVLAIVRRVENGDIFRFSQDIFDIYHVGKNNRGLVMVLAYDDHKFRSHTGRSLEADLTDAECFRLQERYLIPSMKAGVPDSGLIYYVEAVYNTLKGKELPVMSELKSSAEDDAEDSILPAIYFFLLFAWVGIYLVVASRHGWNLKRYAGSLLVRNPFTSDTAAATAAGIILGSGGRGGHSGGFGGGGSFGGGFGGGSSGGGGATSSW